MTKPSTVLKLKANFVSLLTENEQPQLKDIKVSVVRNSQIISIMVNMTSFIVSRVSRTDRKHFYTKFYSFEMRGQANFVPKLLEFSQSN